MLASFICGDAAARLGRKPLAVRRAAVLDALVQLFGEEARERLIDYREGKWPDNPWCVGGLVGWGTGSNNVRAAGQWVAGENVGRCEESVYG